ncbi:MAG: dTDP-4-dehydrorhamnose 3,5-epimerase [Candidatus Latescibacteria bacterium]|nr:dTDP-4-dehydrorhamnose 3,5-epimerase [Candidatus Latescibacterota bacterium]
MPFEFTPLAIPDVILITAKQFPDDRGFFMETYKETDFASNGITCNFVQDNYSRSTYGVLRGLHYQKDPDAQGKLVSVIKGKIYDVAVDIRQGSPHYGQCVGVELSDERPELLWVPEGFAHGFCVLSDTVDFTYKCSSAEYAPDTYRGIAWDDPDLNISWPIPNPNLSERDQTLPQLKDADNNYEYTRIDE